MASAQIYTDNHIHMEDEVLAGYLSGSLDPEERERIEAHAAGCAECLGKIVSAHESVSEFSRTRTAKERLKSMKKINPYLVLAILSFILSFIFRHFFIQFLVATLLLGAKWIIDSKTTRLLVTIYEAWKHGGEKEASRVLKELNPTGKKRF